MSCTITLSLWRCKVSGSGGGGHKTYATLWPSHGRQMSRQSKFWFWLTWPLADGISLTSSISAGVVLVLVSAYNSLYNSSIIYKINTVVLYTKTSPHATSNHSLDLFWIPIVTVSNRYGFYKETETPWL